MFHAPTNAALLSKKMAQKGTIMVEKAEDISFLHVGTQGADEHREKLVELSPVLLIGCKLAMFAAYSMLNTHERCS